jgi:hypothetical protein
MSTYLFVTRPEYTPERVESGFEVPVPWWSCSSTTENGDWALVYVTGLGIRYEWRLTSDAKPDEEWKYVCNVEYARTFAPPITLREIRAAVPKDDWAPPHLDFRGYKSILVPDAVADRIRALRPGTPETNTVRWDGG